MSAFEWAFWVVEKMIDGVIWLVSRFTKPTPITEISDEEVVV